MDDRFEKLSADEVVAKLDTDFETGLTHQEAKARLNRLGEQERDITKLPKGPGGHFWPLLK